MPNMSLKKNPMPHQDADVRNKNFEEVALGYTAEQAVDEAERCLNCKNKPCVNGCPVMVHIPEFIAKIREKDFEGAYQVISQSSSLPAVCGRVCPQESQCEKYCIRGIKGEPVGIGRLERFVADYHNANCKEKPAKPVSNGIKVAVVGSGPSGLTCAGDLAKKGQASFLGIRLCPSALQKHQAHLTAEIVHHILNEHGQVMLCVIDLIVFLPEVAREHDAPQLFDQVDDHILVRLPGLGHLVDLPIAGVILQDRLHHRFNSLFHGRHCLSPFAFIDLYHNVFPLSTLTRA